MRRIVLAALILLVVACRGPAPPSVSEDPLPRLEDERHPQSPELLEALHDESPARRARAALAMGRIQSVAYIEPLAAATRDDDRSVRIAALFALGQQGLLQGAEPPQAAIDGCLPSLEDPDTGVVTAALEALGKLAGPGMPPLVLPFLEHETPDVRAAAAMALFRCRFAPLWRGQSAEAPPLPDSAVAALLEGMDDADVGARLMKVYAFSRYAQPEAATRLAEFVADENEWVRLFAVRGIGRAGESAAAPAVESALSDTADRVRTEAVATLAALGLADRIPGSMAEDSSFHVRMAIAAALGAAQSSDSLDVLRRLERDSSPGVRGAALDALARRLGEKYDLAARLEDPDWRIRAAAAGAAGHLDQAADVVEMAMRDADTRVRSAALATLETVAESRETVFEALRVDDLALRGTAAALLAESEDYDEATLDRLTTAYDDSPGVEWIEVRESIVDAVGQLDEAEQLLSRMAGGDTAFSVRAKARAALAERGVELPEESEPAVEPSRLLGVHFDADPQVLLETSKGEIRIRCLADEAPIHVASFVELVGDGYYDGLIWHRVVSNFVIQGGDPRGDGWGGAGYTLRDEINTSRYGRGAVGMPKAGKDTGGGQIFITHVPTPHLDGNYTVFGQVVEGLDVVDRIEVGDAIVRARVVQ